MSYSSTVLATSGLVSYWRLGESVGPSAADSFGANTGTYVNTPTLAQTGALAGDSDTAVLFASASTQAVTVTHNATLNLADTFTLEAWIKRTATQGTDQGIVSKGFGAYYLRINSDNKVHLLRSQVADMVGSTITITDTTTWHHLVATKSGATMNLYIDSVDVTGATSNSTCADNTATLAIASDNQSSTTYNPINYADLYIDEVAVYSTALSAATVLAHYTAGSTTAASPDGAYVRDFTEHTFGPF